MAILLTEDTPKRRDKLVIMAEIINIAKKGTSKTRIMFSANLSFAQLNQYLDHLSQARLLEKSAINGKELYRATDRGLKFMEKQCELINFLNKETNKKSLKTSFEFSTSPQSKILLY